ncbi:hypothetical protein AG1IA_08866 [Rhizoctonia solani AG-1 IA]|uniref:Uncharacterized protein n=1 Tax=Thanatephorus cucumeris (strain AG1-IA) TaxID=983506 RepID=L8WL75_THACA|nr:hypothetical protein AG1IA_08866 [Rhizoctonia solani AG-1 IA]
MRGDWGHSGWRRGRRCGLNFTLERRGGAHGSRRVEPEFRWLVDRSGWLVDRSGWLWSRCRGIRRGRERLSNRASRLENRLGSSDRNASSGLFWGRTLRNSTNRSDWGWGLRASRRRCRNRSGNGSRKTLTRTKRNLTSSRGGPNKRSRSSSLNRRRRQRFFFPLRFVALFFVVRGHYGSSFAFDILDTPGALALC